MDIFLLVITAVSLAAAFVSIMAMRKLKHADQLRSDARVAALVAAADALPIRPDPEAELPSAVLRNPVRPGRAAGRSIAATTEGAWSSVAGEWQWNPEPVTDRAAVAEPLRVDHDTVTTSADMFGTVQREQPASRRFALAAALVLIAALGGAMVVFTTSNREKPAAAEARHTTAASPLELVTLSHSREASNLTINGVVRNPANGPKVEGLTAVVSLIDEHGGLISTKDVPLDYRALGPGEEAPFKVTVPDPGSIARYRVSFRAGTDVIPHVDRRTDAKLASAL